MIKKIFALILFLILFAFLVAIIFVFKIKNIDNKKLLPITSLKIYFNNNLLDPYGSCDKVFPVERKVYGEVEPLRTALEKLLQGPSEQEKKDGYFTSINSGVLINNVSVKNGVAFIDFNEQLEFQVGGSCRVASIRAQIEKTIEQFENIKKAIISINGRTEDILQP